MNSNEKLKLLLELIVNTAQEEIDCDEVMFRLAAYVENETQHVKLNSVDSERLRQHLSVCDECQEELDLLENLMDPHGD